MGIIVIVAYRPLDGKEELLLAELETHVPILRGEGLATDREVAIMRSEGGCYVEVFEWASEEAIKAAHTNPTVGAMWQRFAACCEFRTLTDLPEAKDMFASFTPVN